MELELGMYVRTINGKIWIINSQKAISGHRKDIIKASHNIIDIIEVGDYVNGFPVIHKENDILKCGLLVQFKENEIKSIVTKEQFESMSYKIN